MLLIIFLQSLRIAAANPLHLKSICTRITCCTGCSKYTSHAEHCHCAGHDTL